MTSGSAALSRGRSSLGRPGDGLVAVGLVGATALVTVWLLRWVRSLLVGALVGQPFWIGLVGGGVFLAPVVVELVLVSLGGRLGSEHRLGSGAITLSSGGGLAGAGIVGLASVTGWPAIGVAAGDPWATALSVGPYAVMAAALLIADRDAMERGKCETDRPRPSPEAIARLRRNGPSQRGGPLPEGPPPEAAGLVDNGASRDEGAATATAESGVLSDCEFAWERETDVSMADVGGMDELKTRLRRAVSKPLTMEQSRIEALGLGPSNVLLYGPPGTGKTYLVQALATEVGLPFVRVSGSDVTSKWINESGTKINALFTEAEQVAEAAGGAIVFLDELDSVLPRRDGDLHAENRKVVNEFLTNLQETAANDVVFIGATNRYDDLDTAAIRRGRIDEHIEVGRPDAEARTGILRAQLDARKHSVPAAALDALADAAEGATAADLAGLVEDAAQHAAYTRDADTILVEDLTAVTGEE